MHAKQKTWLWNAVFIGIVFALSYSVYIASQKIEYNWRWERVVPYIINTDAQEITAPGDGTVEVDERSHQLTLVIDGETTPFVVKEYTELQVSDGDLIFEGDTLATLEQWQIGPLIDGLIVTIEISVYSLVIALVLGLVIGLMRISANPMLRNMAILYIEVIRGTPLLVQIFIMYFFIGTVMDLERFTAGVIALSVFTGAYVAEIIRSGIQSIPVGQMEAARSLGMSYPKAMIFIILPQAFKRTLPPMAGQFINLIKDSSLVSVISITDLTKAGREVVSGSFAPFEVWFTVALLYLVLTSALSWAIQRLEKRLSASD